MMMDDDFLPELWNLTPLIYFPFHLLVNYVRSTKCHQNMAIFLLIIESFFDSSKKVETCWYFMYFTLLPERKHIFIIGIAQLILESWIR